MTSKSTAPRQNSERQLAVEAPFLSIAKKKKKTVLSSENVSESARFVMRDVFKKVPSVRISFAVQERLSRIFGFGTT